VDEIETDGQWGNIESSYRFFEASRPYIAGRNIVIGVLIAQALIFGVSKSETEEWPIR
jgi:hypothetical protein